MEELFIEIEQVTNGALSGGELTTKVNVGEASENKGRCESVIVSMLCRRFVVIGNAISEASDSYGFTRLLGFLRVLGRA
jgi:hypothetical protein